MSKKRRRQLPVVPATPTPQLTPEIEARMDALYAQLPDIDCKGKCWDGCTNIQIADLERERIRQHHGVIIEDTRPATHGLQLCPALTMLKQCGVYDVRPFICRVWGLVRALRCNYGCVPEGGFVHERDAWLLLAEIHDLGGSHQEAHIIRTVMSEENADWAAEYMRRADPRDDPYRQANRNRAMASGATFVAGPGRVTKNRTEQNQ